MRLPGERVPLPLYRWAKGKGLLDERQSLVELSPCGVIGPLRMDQGHGAAPIAHAARWILQEYGLKDEIGRGIGHVVQESQSVFHPFGAAVATRHREIDGAEFTRVEKG